MIWNLGIFFDGIYFIFSEIEFGSEEVCLSVISRFRRFGFEFWFYD